MRTSSIGSVLFVGVTIVSILGCGDIAGVGTAGVSGYYNSGDCSAYGDTCVGEAPVDGAFEMVVLPLDSEVVSVTYKVTYKDVIDGEDISESVDAYESYPGEFWIWSPSVPPEGYIEISAKLVYYDGLEEDMFCSQDPAGDWAAYNNGWEVSANDYYSTSQGCYAKVNLRDVVD